MFVALPFNFDPSLVAHGNTCNESEKGPRLIAICATEESIVRVNKWRNANEPEVSDQQPVTLLSPDEILRYCNWLSENAGLKPSDYCYEEGIDGQMVCKNNFFLLKGYRLPIQVEWSFACAADSKVERFFGREARHLPFYAWHERNADGQIRPVGELLPNAYGMFDILGNCYEWCHVRSDDNRLGFKMYGGSSKSGPSAVTGTQGNRLEDITNPEGFELGGFRLVRTLSNGGRMQLGK